MNYAVRIEQTLHIALVFNVKKRFVFWAAKPFINRVLLTFLISF